MIWAKKTTRHHSRSSVKAKKNQEKKNLPFNFMVTTDSVRLIRGNCLQRENTNCIFRRRLPPPSSHPMLLAHPGNQRHGIRGELQRIHKPNHGNGEVREDGAKAFLNPPHQNGAGMRAGRENVRIFQRVHTRDPTRLTGRRLMRIPHGVHWLFLVRAPQRHAPVVAARDKVLIVNQRNALDRPGGQLEHELGLVQNFPYPHRGVLAAGGDAALLVETVNAAHGVLMAKQRLHVGLLVHVPDLDVAVVAAAEEFVAVDAERHAGHGVAVALEHAVEGHVGGGPDFDYFVGAAGGEKFAVGGEGEAEHCGGVADFGRFVEGDFFDHFPRGGVPFDDGAFLSAGENECA